MSRRLHHGRPACRWRLGAIGAAVMVTLLIGLAVSFGSGLTRSGAEQSGSTPLEASGAPAHGPRSVALTGPRGIAIVAGSSDGRQRVSQLVEPGTASLAGAGPGESASSAVDGRRSPHLALRGLLAVRAPPGQHA
jgi:hypothetical protein